jgi:TolA-binding protein
MGQHVQDFPTSPQNLTARYWQAEAAFRLGNFDDALTQLTALESVTSARTEPWLGVIPLRRAQCLSQQNRWAEALELASTIATRHPQFKQQFEAEYLIGRALGNQGRFDDARVAYLRVLDDPAAKATEIAAMAQWMIGESHFHQQHYAQAVAAYERCLAEHTIPRWQAASLLQAGKCRLLLGQTEEAKKDFSRILSQYADQSVSAEARQRLASLAATATASRPSADKSR